MKYVILIIAVLGLNGCNTLIGLGRDTKEGYNWSKEKVQQMNGGGQSEDDGAVY